MNFFKKCSLPTLVGFALTMGFFVSCEEDLTTIGSGVIGAEAFVIGTETFDVFAYNRNIEAVQTNKLPLYQLGRYNHPIFGNTHGSITSQLQLTSPNPIFGSLSQAAEDTAEADTSVFTIADNETIKEVILYIPYLTTGASRDRDGDGVEDAFDSAPADPENDSDGDGVSNRQEGAAGTNPLDSNSVDADQDGINDTDDQTIVDDNFAQRVTLDSIYGAIDAPFKLKVERSTFFLRDLDPNTNFQQNQTYFSSQEFSPDFVSDVLYDSEESGEELVIDDKQILLPRKDDETTEDVDESLSFQKVQPGIRIALDNQFFQEHILDMEGSSELFTQGNFADFLRGIHISLDSDAPEGLMLLLDLRQASIVLTYTHDFYNRNGTAEDATDDTVDVLEKNFRINLVSGAANSPVISANAVNTFLNEEYPSNVLETLDTDENTSRIFLKGGAGVYTEIQLFEQENGMDIIRRIQSENWIINEANLVFYVDREQLDIVGGVVEPPRLYLYNAESNVPLYNPFTDRGGTEGNPLLNRFPNFDGLLQKSGDDGVRYAVKITDHINNMVVRDSTNATLGLTLTTNILNASAANTILANGEEKSIPVTSILTPLGTVLYGSNISVADPNFAKRLKLEISYTRVD